MKSKTRMYKSTDSLNEFDDYELQATLRDFLREEEKEKSSVWNVATIAGLAMFFVSMLYILQLLGVFSGYTGWMGTLPVVGAILIVLVGFGFLVGDRKRVKKILKKQRKERKEYFDKECDDTESTSDSYFSLENDLFEKKKNNQEGNPFSTSHFDRYALKQPKKIYKSRSDKKIAGVCGGLAQYFGFNANIIRFLFIVLTVAGGGAAILVYFALVVALDKEPVDLLAVNDFKL